MGSRVGVSEAEKQVGLSASSWTTLGKGTIKRKEYSYPYYSMIC